MATPTNLPATFVAGNVLTASQMNNLRGAFRILQVVQTLKTDIFSSGLMNQGTEVDVTGLSATITPRETSSRILVITSVNANSLGSALAHAPITTYRVYRGATSIGQGDAAGNRSRVAASGGVFTTSTGMANVNAVILDSPNTTSSTTYKVTFVNSFTANATAFMNLNYSNADTDNNFNPRAASSITLLEVSA